MQKICKTCRKELYNLMSNFCSQTCFKRFDEVRKEELVKSIKEEQKMGRITNTSMKLLIIRVKQIHDPMVAEYQ